MQLYTTLTYNDQEQSKSVSTVKEMFLLAKEMIHLSK
jgi:hypothetical protein